MSAAAVLCELSEAPLSIDRVIDAVRHPSIGGIAVFLGTVRDAGEAGAVTLLEYEAYPSMAARELRAILEEIAAELPGVRLAVVHRVGRLAVGDVAVACAAGAPHRDAAFTAARAMIDRIKQRAPIWKREHGPEGPYWVGWVEHP
jgi:molybdopterin synthase catalytic subunit